MNTRIRIDHLTRYTYSQSVSFSEHLLYLKPRECPNRQLEEFRLACSPPSRLRWFRDCFDNPVCTVNFGLQQARELCFHLQAEVVIRQQTPFDFLLHPDALRFPFSYSAADRDILQPYQAVDPQDEPDISQWWRELKSSRSWADETVSFLSTLNTAISESVRYRKRDEPGIQTPAHTLASGTGSCRDCAVLFLALCRHLGLAGRFVSGYLYIPGDENTAPDAPDGNASTHAWAEIYLPGAGWTGFDPTHGLWVNTDYIAVAVANQAARISPIQGTLYADTPVESGMEVKLSLSRESIPADV